MSFIYGDFIERGNDQVIVGGSGLVTFFLWYYTNLYSYMIGFYYLPSSGQTKSSCWCKLSANIFERGQGLSCSPLRSYSWARRGCGRRPRIPSKLPSKVKPCKLTKPCTLIPRLANRTNLRDKFWAQCLLYFLRRPRDCSFIVAWVLYPSSYPRSNN